MIVPAPTDALTPPMALTIVLATVALAAIAVYVRRARLAGSLTAVTALASGVSAAGILTSALAATLIVGGVGAASAAVPPASTTSVIGSLTRPASHQIGFQLDTR